MTARQILKRLLTPVALLLATLYFLIDALFLPIIRPLAARVSRLPVLARVVAWVKSLGPYGSLALFLVPVILLEPVKPLGALLIGRRYVGGGLLLIILGEVLKVAIVERLFHLTRDKLMTIRAFAWCFDFAVRWIAYLRRLPAWQAAERWLERLRRLGRQALARLRAWLARGPLA
jgi:hypothetical protein